MHLKLRMEKKLALSSRGISENILSYKDYKKLFKGEMLIALSCLGKDI